MTRPRTLTLALATLALAGCADPTVAPARELAPGTALAATTDGGKGNQGGGKGDQGDGTGGGQGAASGAVIPLPRGFTPEGITAGRGQTLYVGSLSTGAIWRGDARRGEGALLVPAQAGRILVGLAYDRRGHRIFAAGGPTGQAHVFDAATGRVLATYQLAPAGQAFVNDVVVLRDAVYLTDSFRPVLYRIPLGAGGGLPASAAAVQTIPLGGEWTQVAGQFNANGIVALPNARTLLVVNSTTGALFRVDPSTGRATRLALAGGATVPGGDGLVRRGRHLYVVQGQLNRVSVVRLGADRASGAIERTITSPEFRIPTTAALVANALYVVNGRFDVAPPPAPAPNVEFQVVRVRR